jgi:iron complex transport system ATP-binding protein
MENRCEEADAAASWSAAGASLLQQKASAGEATGGTKMEPLLSVLNLCFSYDTRPVLREVSLTLALGEVVALLGPNGSGKSTLLRALLGQLDSRGTIAWNGQSIAKIRRRDLARLVAYLPQSPTWEPQQTVADVLRLGRSPYLRAFGLETPRDIEVVNQVAQTLELCDLLHRPLDALSGGQRQRVFLGRCLVQEPQAMLLDEPNTFLDLKHQVELGRLLVRLARERNIAVLMASHDLNIAGQFAGRLILLHEGAVVADGSADRVLDPQLLERVYGLPMRRLSHDGTSYVFPAVNH